MSNPTEAQQPKRTTMRTVALITVIAVVVGLVGGWAIASATSQSDNGDVWVVQSQTASVSTASIELDNVGDSVLLVSVDNGGEVDAVSVSQLVQDWDDEFGDTTPRAVISGLVDGFTHSLIVNLGKPTATATSITFEGSTIVDGGIGQTDFTVATLLIDNNGLVEAKLKESQAS